MIICIATAIAIVWPETFCERNFKNPVDHLNKPEKFKAIATPINNIDTVCIASTVITLCN